MRAKCPVPGLSVVGSLCSKSQARKKVKRRQCSRALSMQEYYCTIHREHALTLAHCSSGITPLVNTGESCLPLNLASEGGKGWGDLIRTDHTVIREDTSFLHLSQHFNLVFLSFSTCGHHPLLRNIYKRNQRPRPKFLYLALTTTVFNLRHTSKKTSPGTRLEIRWRNYWANSLVRNLE